MQNRLGLFVLYVTLIALCAFSGSATAGMLEVFHGLPGGEAGLPGFTLLVYTMLGWIAGWGGWLLLAAGIGVFFGIPKALSRTESGRAKLAAFDRVLEQYYGVALALSIAMLFTVYWTIALATHLPLLQIVDQLTGG